MKEIRIRLAGAGNLGPMAAPMVGMGMLPAGMPVGAPGGIYLILNGPTNNRYVGISTNIANRFIGRMAVINELGFAAGTLAQVWAWWGRISTRRFPPPVVFPSALATTLAGLPLANRYVMPGGAATVCPAVIPIALPPIQPQVAAQADAILPIRYAVAAFAAWHAVPAPRTAFAIGAAWPGGIAPPPFGGMPFAIAGAMTAQAAADAVALLAGAPAAIATLAAAALQSYAAGILPPPSHTRSVVAQYLGAAPLAVPAAASVALYRNPMAGPPTTLNFTFPDGTMVDLEHVYIRFVMLHLLGGAIAATVTNGAKTAAIPWPGGPEPIAVTWNSIAGAGYAAYARSVIWWPGTAF